MKECDELDALTVAELSCRECLARKLEGMKVYRFRNPGDPDCAVFDIGYLQTGDLTVNDAQSYHFRAHLDLYNRDHDKLQRDIMRLLLTLPVNADIRTGDEVREESNVIVFRIAPETQAVGEIVQADVQPAKDGNPIMCYTAAVKFDVVFAARF